MFHPSHREEQKITSSRLNECWVVIAQSSRSLRKEILCQLWPVLPPRIFLFAILGIGNAQLGSFFGNGEVIEATISIVRVKVLVGLGPRPLFINKLFLNDAFLVAQTNRRQYYLGGQVSDVMRNFTEDIVIALLLQNSRKVTEVAV